MISDLPGRATPRRLWGLGLPVVSQQATVLARNPRVGIRGPGKRIRGEEGSTRNGNAFPATSGIA